LVDRPRRYVIVGNGVAGTTAAETLRKNDPSCAVTLLSDEPYPLYNRVALPPFIKHRTPREKVFMRTVDQHRERGIDLRLETRVEKVDTEGRTVTTSAAQELPYDALLVATGGRPLPLRTEGAQDAGAIYNFQYFDDAEAIISRMKEAHVAAVVGGSYIAYELAEAFRHNGLDTTWLIRGPYFLRRVLDPEGGALVDCIAREHGVQMVYGEEVAQVESAHGTITAIVSNKGRRVETEMLGAGLGMRMNLDLLAGTPVKLHDGIVVDQYLETNIAGVFAAGDIAEFYDVTTERHNMMGTWGNAAGHGRVAGLNMAGQRTVYEDIPMYSSSLFNSYIRVIGLTPENCPGLEACTHLDKESRSYQRLFFLDNRLVGAVLIGDMRSRQKIFAAIRSRLTVDPAERPALITSWTS
jgi:3-phenylpropionate/trans-cinnamate dioxygenase ferredoxin reductase subunit